MWYFEFGIPVFYYSAFRIWPYGPTSFHICPQYFTLVHYSAIWLFSDLRFFTVFDQFGRIAKKLAVRFSIYSAVWIRSTGQVRFIIYFQNLIFFFTAITFALNFTTHNFNVYNERCTALSEVEIDGSENYS